MSFDIEKAFEVDKDGFAIRDESSAVVKYDVGGQGPPYGNDAPVGTQYIDFTNNVRYRKIKAGTGADAWQFDVAKHPLFLIDGGTHETSRVFEAYDNAGGQAIGAFPTITTLPFPSVRAGSDLTAYTFPAIGEVEFQIPGDYWIDGHGTFNFGSGGFKTCAAVPQIDTGSGYANVPGAFGWTPVVNAALNYASAPFGFLFSGVNAGDKVRIGMTIFTGGTVVNTGLGSTLRIKPVVPKKSEDFLLIDAGTYDGSESEPISIIDPGEF